MISDVRRAYFYARATRDIIIDVPEEGPARKDGQIAKLRFCLYGTRICPRPRTAGGILSPQAPHPHIGAWR